MQYTPLIAVTRTSRKGSKMSQKIDSLESYFSAQTQNKYRKCVYCQRIEPCIDLFGEVICPDCAMRIFQEVSYHDQF